MGNPGNLIRSRAKSHFQHDLAPRGRAGQPGPRAENRERGEEEPRWKLPSSAICAMTGELSPKSPENAQLALAIAQGMTVAAWASSEPVCPERTAYRWAADPKVRANVESMPPPRPSTGRRPDGHACHLGGRSDRRAWRQMPNPSRSSCRRCEPSCPT